VSRRGSLGRLSPGQRDFVVFFDSTCHLRRCRSPESVVMTNGDGARWPRHRTLVQSFGTTFRARRPKCASRPA
jgi:hypothetical protein